MSRILASVAAALACCACNSAPANTCTPSTPSVAAAGMPSSTCQDDCVNALTLLGDAGAAFLPAGVTFDVCAVNCTEGGNALCSPQGMTCLSFEPYTAASYCVVPCSLSDAGDDAAGNAGDAGVCPTGTVCTAAGFCL